MKTPKVTFIIGLPGAGKTKFLDKRFYGKVEFWPFDDWMGWNVWINGNPPKGKFNEEPRYNALIDRLNNNEHIVLLSIRFCDHDFLCESEYFLKSKFPDIEIERIYFENNPENSIANILYRIEKDNEHHWVDEDGNEKYFGQHHPTLGIPAYKISIENVEKFTSNYIIPYKYIPLPYPKYKDIK